MKKKHPQEVLDEKRQVTLQFSTVEEKDVWVKWYSTDGANYFWSWLATPRWLSKRWWKTKKGLYWRKVAEDKLDNWPKDNERFVK